VSSIQQVLEENGLRKPESGATQGGVVQGELFEVGDPKQLLLSLGHEPDNPGRQERSGGPEREGGIEPAGLVGDEAAGPEMGIGSRRNYSSAQRVYLDQLEQGAYNTYAGGLLFAPLLAQYSFLPTLRRVITIPTHEGYSLDELGLTLFYLDVFGFRSLEDFKRAYPEEFGLLMGRTQSPSLFTLRRFPHKMRKLGQGEALIDEFALTYLKCGLAAWGVMYIDGPFLPY